MLFVQWSTRGRRSTYPEREGGGVVPHPQRGSTRAYMYVWHGFASERRVYLARQASVVTHCVSSCTSPRADCMRGAAGGGIATADYSQGPDVSHLPDGAVLPPPQHMHRSASTARGTVQARDREEPTRACVCLFVCVSMRLSMLMHESLPHTSVDTQLRCSQCAMFLLASSRLSGPRRRRRSSSPA